ncbi:non-oxidative hydroxyarylic acid decarboxylases subunit D [Paenibacillus pinistramenti]|uniref:non-oxidative hydroxyarylic acid decarboxylases subunit D n=1 Tax=Paenibacillus pinistramenti TaxID=1768003 RepID=UPI001109466C|nr:non-oxidative hydroxyarylic acid decarboxylases subunit D [Paenibacillus pinistramenti]
MHTCPRCESKTASVVAVSPVKGVWEVYLCPVCIFTWRSTEPETITNPEKYNPAFKVNPEEIPFAAHVPPIARRLH